MREPGYSAYVNASEAFRLMVIREDVAYTYHIEKKGIHFSHCRITYA